MATDACLKCAKPLERPDTGRPPDYCSPACRRSAEFELRRLQRHLEGLEKYASNLRLQGYADPGQTRRVKREIARAEERLLLLLAAQSEPDVSPP